MNSNSNYGILTHGAPPNDSEGRGGMGGEGGSLAGSACIFAAGPNSAAGVAPPVAGRKIRLIFIISYSLRRTFFIRPREEQYKRQSMDLPVYFELQRKG